MLHNCACHIIYVMNYSVGNEKIQRKSMLGPNSIYLDFKEGILVGWKFVDSLQRFNPYVVKNYNLSTIFFSMPHYIQMCLTSTKKCT